MLQAIGALLLMLGSNVTVSARTGSVTSFPWTEDFNNLTEEGSIPTGWNNSGGTTTDASYKWGYSTNSSSQERGFGSCNGTGHDGSKCIRFDSYNNDENNTNLLKTRTISLPDSPNMELSFWYRNPAGGDFSVYISTDGGNTYETALVTGLTGAPMWKEQFISLGTYKGQDVVIVFKGTSNYGEDFTDAYIYLDDVTVGYAKPKNLTIKKANKNEADLSWTAPQDESPTTLKYAYRYKKAADNAWSLESEVTNIFVTLSSLAEVTQYDFQVRAVYADGAKSAYTSINFMTPFTNEGEYFIWSEDFNSLTEDGSIPANWDNSEGTITKYLIRWGYSSSFLGIGAYNGTSFDGSNCVVFNSNHNDDGTTNCLKTLPIKLPGNGATLSFWYKNPWGGDFSVYISTDGGATYENTPLVTNLTNAYDWTREKIHLDAYGDKSVVIVFKGTSNHNESNDDAYIYLDDVIIWDRGIGLPPTYLTATKITQHTAQLDWRDNNPQANYNGNWDIYFKRVEDCDYTILSNVKKPYAFKNLEAGTAYDFFVFDKAYATAISSKVYTFSTLGEPVNSFPWTENFNSLSKAGTIPEGWVNNDGITLESDYRWSYSGSGRNGTGCVRFDSHENYSGGTNFLKTIPLSLPATPTMQLDFWYKNPKGGNLSVYISTDDGANYETALVTGLTGAADWKKLDEPIRLEAYAGREVVIVFKGTSNHGDGDAYIYLDDITVDEASPCAAPSRPFVTNNKPHAVDLGWRANGDESSWTIYYKKVGDTNYTEVAGVTENPYTLTGLKANTDYEFYVTAACPAASEGYTASKICQFSTFYTVDPTHPFFEGFEGTTIVPPLWDNSNFSGERWVRDNITAHTGSFNALATNGSGSGYSYLVMPSIELAYDISSATLTFWSYYMYLEDYAGGKTSVVLINGTSETELWALSQEEAKSMTNMQWYETSIDLTVYRGQTIQLAFKYESNNAHIWHLDDVSLAVVQTSLEVETATNGSIAFYGDVSCTGDPITATGTGCTVYIKATPQSGFACGLADANGKVSFIKVEKTVKSGVTQTQGTDLGSFIDVYATTTPGVFSFTMPNDANIRVKATAVFPKAVTVTAQAASKFVGEDDPTLTATVEGVVGTDKINYTISRAEGETPGEYAISVTGEATQGNYVVTFVNGAKLTITAKPGDINLDGKVNVADVVKAVSAGKTKDEIDAIINIIMDK